VRGKDAEGREDKLRRYAAFAEELGK
jgi:hypothetical protein